MDNDINDGKTVHEVLAHSYLSFLILCSIGLFLDMVFPLKFNLPYLWLPAIFCLLLGPAVILWAQKTSRQFTINRLMGIPIKEESFRRGPYRFVRNPTHVGLVILVLGYALISSSSILFAMTLLAVLISNRQFRLHEKILLNKYGEAYGRYQASVPSIM